MRMPEEEENLVGKIGVCSIGRVGIITDQHSPEWVGGQVRWSGIGLDGKGVWSSSKPCIIAESAEEFRQRLIEISNQEVVFNLNDTETEE